MKSIGPILAGLLLQATSTLAFTIAEQGKAGCGVLIDREATAPEKNAAKELAQTLQQITGAAFAVKEIDSAAPARSIVVGLGRAAKTLFPEIPFEQLGSEELIMKLKGDHLLLAGGRPRGTLYAVSRFLQDSCGVRWWTPWASRIPHSPNLGVETLEVRAKPAFELRDPYWYPAFDAQWAVRNLANGQSGNIPPELGDCVRYNGFVHTFYPLVPPEKHFQDHPEWFSLLKGRRSTDRSQLCLTNPKLRDFTVERVKEWLRQSPEASIISVSQNDCYGACECVDCKPLDDAEGSHSGTMLAFVNHVAEKIEPEFPHVAIDTLAYQYTRKPPRTLRPRPNVIVRLCSIECNFREPLDHPSNAAFAQDILGWSKISQRLYIWDYVTDFAHYVQPHPNWFTLGPNLRFFQEHSVRGVFEEGAYQSHGSEMSELRAWVLAQLLWNPKQDDRALINEFLEGYYGPGAAPHLRAYLDLLHEASRGHNLTCYSPPNTPFLKFKHLTQAENLWQEAERATTNNSEFLPRVRLGHLPVLFVALSQWAALRKECEDGGQKWPWPESQKQLAQTWKEIASGVPGLPWTKVTQLNEGGLTPEKFLARFQGD